MQCRASSATGGDHVVTVSGEVDLSSAPRLAETLVQFTNGTVIVDLSDVTFFDASGLRALMAARRHIERRNGRLIVHGMSRNVRKVLDAVDLDLAHHVDSKTAANGSADDRR
jgi:anti-sigma B factor antagonist